VIAATLYQSLMAHVSTSSRRNTQRRTPRQQNGVSCISIASSSALASSNYLSRSQIIPSACGRRSSFRGSTGGGGGAPSRSGRKKRVSNSSLSSHSNVINETAELETSTEERRRKSHKSKRAPPVPTTVPGSGAHRNGGGGGPSRSGSIVCGNGHVNRLHQNAHPGKKSSELPSGCGDVAPANGDILTRVAIPRSGSFLNTGGLTRYKSRAARRHSGKLGGGGGGGGG